MAVHDDLVTGQPLGQHLGEDHLHPLGAGVRLGSRVAVLLVLRVVVTQWRGVHPADAMKTTRPPSPRARGSRSSWVSRNGPNTWVATVISCPSAVSVRSRPLVPFGLVAARVRGDESVHLVHPHRDPEGLDPGGEPDVVKVGMRQQQRLDVMRLVPEIGDDTQGLLPHGRQPRIHERELPAVLHQVAVGVRAPDPVDPVGHLLAVHAVPPTGRRPSAVPRRAARQTERRRVDGTRTGVRTCRPGRRT